MSLDVSAFRLEEVFRIAIRLEDDGIAFYRAASEKLSSRRLRDVLDGLVVQEVEHRLVFQALAAEFGTEFTSGKIPKEIPPQIVQALIEAEVFPPPEERDAAIASLHSPAQVLRFAIRVEQGSVEFYKAAATAAKSQKVHDAFTRVLDQEYKHLRLLNAELKVHKAHRAP